jgi:hypothetical protein
MARLTSVLTRPDRTAPPPSSPPAARPHRAWWRDMRVVAGVVLIVVSMLAGARLLAGGSDTVSAWQATRNLSVGAVLGADDVVAVSLPAGLGGAYAEGATLPSAPLDRPLLTGELVPLPGESVTTDARWVTVPIEPLHAPVDLSPGERVDVWSTEDADLGAVSRPRLVLEGALVTDVAVDGVGLGGEYGVVLRVAPGEASALLTAVRSGGTDLVRVPALTVTSTTAEVVE